MSSQFAAVNREAIWVALFNHLAAPAAALTAPPWAPNTVYQVGQIVVANPPGEPCHLQQVVTAGTSSSSIPAFNFTGETTPEGPTTLVWQDLGPGFVTMGRKHKKPPALTRAEQSALFVVQAKETHIPQGPPGMPPKLVLHGFLIVYLLGPTVNELIGEETWLAATELNGLFTAIDNAFQPDHISSGKFTLGGLVTHCWIQGDASQDPGILGPQCAAIKPLHILID
jgi:hypothetical protein